MMTVCPRYEERLAVSVTTLAKTSLDADKSLKVSTKEHSLSQEAPRKVLLLKKFSPERERPEPELRQAERGERRAGEAAEGGPVY